MSGRATIMLSAALALAAAAPAAAQEAGQPDSAQLREWVTEAQRIQQRLANVQQQVLADPEIAEQRAEVAALVEEAVAEADPSLTTDLERARELEPQMAEAREAGDEERVQSLVAEARALEARIARAQQAALQDPDLSRIVLAFNERVEQRFVELEPEAPQMVERLQEIRARLQAVTNQ